MKEGYEVKGMKKEGGGSEGNKRNGSEGRQDKK